MELNFGSIANSGNGISYLHAWNIYEDVKFDGVDDPKTGTSANGTSWKSWSFNFSCPKGVFSKSIFAPTDMTIKRRQFTNANGHEITFPSGFEENKEFIAQVLKAYNPEGFKKLCEIAPKIKTFDEFIAAAKKLLTNVTKTTNIKLTGRASQDGRVFADIPRLCAINSKTGELFTSDVFIGDNVSFTDYQLGKKKEYEAHKPSSSPAITTDNIIVSETPSNDDDKEIGDLLNELL